MFCSNCGHEIDDRAVICPHCGVATKNSGMPVTPESKTNTLAIVGFVLSFFVSVAGLACSIIARKQIRETGEGGSGFALAGIIISSISIGLTVLIGIIYGSLIGLMIGGIAQSGVV